MLAACDVAGTTLVATPETCTRVRRSFNIQAAHHAAFREAAGCTVRCAEVRPCFATAPSITAGALACSVSTLWPHTRGAISRHPGQLLCAERAVTTCWVLPASHSELGGPADLRHSCRRRVPCLIAAASTMNCTAAGVPMRLTPKDVARSGLLRQVADTPGAFSLPFPRRAGLAALVA